LCNSCASLAGLVSCFIACFILLVIAPLRLPDGKDGDRSLLLGVVVTVMNAPLDRPKTIYGYGSERVRRGKHAVVVDDHPDATESATERPVTVHDADGVEDHRTGGHNEVGGGQVTDQDGERLAQLLLELVGEQNEHVGYGADGDERK